MASIKFILYQNLPIYYTDLSSANSAEIIETCRDSQRWMQRNGLSENSLYSLVNLRNTQLTPESAQVIRETMQANRHFVKASAIFGLDHMSQAFTPAMMVFAGREVRVFSELESAKTWLRHKAASQH